MGGEGGGDNYCVAIIIYYQCYNAGHLATPVLKWVPVLEWVVCSKVAYYDPHLLRPYAPSAYWGIVGNPLFLYLTDLALRHASKEEGLSNYSSIGKSLRWP